MKLTLHRAFPRAFCQILYPDCPLSSQRALEGQQKGLVLSVGKEVLNGRWPEVVDVPGLEFAGMPKIVELSVQSTTRNWMLVLLEVRNVLQSCCQRLLLPLLVLREWGAPVVVFRCHFRWILGLRRRICLVNVSSYHINEYTSLPPYKPSSRVMAVRAEVRHTSEALTQQSQTSVTRLSQSSPTRPSSQCLPQSNCPHSPVA